VSAGDQSDVIGVEDADASFEEFVDGSSARLFTMALLLTGRHRAEAEDLLQGVLERAYRRWGRICRKGDPEPYVRRMLVNASVDRWRLLRRRHTESLPAAGIGASGEASASAVADQASEIADRDLLVRALAVLPPGQRAVLVLRYFCDLSEAQTAATLGCSVGSVKSQASRALARLRQVVGPELDRESGSTGGAVHHE
jgi:RNA polymerase sigma-70 factor (sigma-E family)